MQLTLNQEFFDTKMEQKFGSLEKELVFDEFC